MAYGPNAVGKDGNRGIQGDSAGPESAHMPDGYLASVGSLVAPAGGLGRPTMGQSRQPIPGSQDINPREQYSFQSPGEPGLLGQDTDDYGAAGLTDNERPVLPNPEFPGESGTTNMGPQGDPVDFNSVAPYEYPDFGDWPNRSASDPTAATGQ